MWVTERFKIRKKDGIAVGKSHFRCFDADEESKAKIANQEDQDIANSRFYKIEDWVRSMRRSDGNRVTVVELLWPVVGKLIEGEQA
jgi:hypothetical protein